MAKAGLLFLRRCSRFVRAVARAGLRPYDTFVGKGTVGGFVETFESVGIAAADLAIEILEGKAPAALPPRTNSGQHYRVDHRAMQKWNLSEITCLPVQLLC